MLQAAAALRDLDDLRELAFRYEPELAIGDLRHCGPGEGYWWHVARQLLDGVVVEVGVRSAEFTTDLDRDPSFFKDGVFLMSAVPHQVMAFGKLLCEIPVDVYLQGYVATCARDGDGLLRIKIAKSQGSVARWRLASSEPLEEFDPTHSSRKL